MDKEIHKNLLKRHNELKGLGKVTEAVLASGVTHKTYNRAINDQKYVRASTIINILEAQAKVLELTKKKLQLA